MLNETKKEQPNNSSPEIPIKQPDGGPDIWDDGNLVNAFDLLLRIDMRINPHLYKTNNEND